MTEYRTPGAKVANEMIVFTFIVLASVIVLAIAGMG